ncbi:Unknown protein [Striga hermonthica]|uniref:F-box domain-containing protein n=1 Tax=Striga hermonthica TaxID=68872 RepID=A0A9N7N417_STRHE|nr:Unknown protein [Striga hermonthica]
MTNFCSDPLPEEFRSDPKFAANTQSPTGVVVASDNRTTCKYFRMRFKFANLESLPEDLLLDILARLPAHVIRDPVSLVCPKWYHLTRTRDFIHAHFQRATSGLLLYSAMFPKELIFISMKEGRVEKFRSRNEYGCRIWSSCNGLAFGSCSCYSKSRLCILNPATNQHYDLPPYIHSSSMKFYSCLAYAVASKEYKVVLCHCLGGRGGVRTYGCDILTVGVDTSWRHVRIQHLSETSRRLLCDKIPLTTEGFVHWVADRIVTVLTMNVETETISESLVPLPRAHRGKRMFYLSTGRYLTVLVPLGNFSWDVWQMESETGEWVKVISIDLEDEKWRFDQFLQHRNENLVLHEDMMFFPDGWLDYPDVLVFHSAPRNRRCFAYKVRTREISFELSTLTLGGSYIFRFHKSTLLSVG